MFKSTLPVLTSLDLLRILMQHIPATWTDFNAKLKSEKQSLKIIFIFLIDGLVVLPKYYLELYKIADTQPFVEPQK